MPINLRYTVSITSASTTYDEYRESNAKAAIKMARYCVRQLGDQGERVTITRDGEAWMAWGRSHDGNGRKWSRVNP